MRSHHAFVDHHHEVRRVAVRLVCQNLPKQWIGGVEHPPREVDGVAEGHEELLINDVHVKAGGFAPYVPLRSRRSGH